ncbi:MAG: copper amine oxidase N-terminal domain-containing protein [Candidatus Eremiobacteraeota bacterium]|nr:copper amine oxidase N-terminal domain-containing protein [Candidatus Eremiobacteraeota bacterium]
MTYYSAGVLSESIVACLALTSRFADASVVVHPVSARPAVAQVTAPPSVPPSAPAPDFGSPPSDDVQILFNDRHVYAKDRRKGNRVLTAIVRNNVILVPMRSMFEQMGGTVRYEPGTRTVDVTKPGSDVRVTVGKPEVVINNESRPLDVPPMIYQGSVVVPLRVLSEGLGGYVAWLPERRLVIVRYLPAPVPQVAATETPAPPALRATPSPVPSNAPTATAPTAAGSRRERFVVGDYVFSPKAYNELSPGNAGSSSFRAAAAAEFSLFNLPWMLEGDFRSFRYPHVASGGTVCPNGGSGCVTAIGGRGQTLVPSFRARDDDFDGRFALKVAEPRIYIGIGYLFRNTNYEGGPSPTQQHGLGFGIDKLPDLERPFSLHGSAYYFPDVSTNSSQALSSGSFGEVQYRVLKYAVGGTIDFAKSPIYLDLGYLGEQTTVKQNAPSGEEYTGPYAGLGIHF